MRCAHCESTISLRNLFFQVRPGFPCNACGEHSYVAEGEARKIARTFPVALTVGVFAVVTYLIAIANVHSFAADAAIVLGIAAVYAMRQWALQSAQTTRRLTESQSRMIGNAKLAIAVVVPVVIALRINETRAYLPDGASMLLVAVGGIFLFWMFWTRD